MADFTVKFTFPERVIEAYTYGDCWALALAIHKITDLTLVTVANKGTPEQWSHVAVRYGLKHVIDIEGVHRVDYWLERWDGYTWGPGAPIDVDTTPQTLLEQIKGDGTGKLYPEYAPARYAKKIITMLGLDAQNVVG